MQESKMGKQAKRNRRHADQKHETCNPIGQLYERPLVVMSITAPLHRRIAWPTSSYKLRTSPLRRYVIWHSWPANMFQEVEQICWRPRREIVSDLFWSAPPSCMIVYPTLNDDGLEYTIIRHMGKLRLEMGMKGEINSAALVHLKLYYYLLRI